MDVTNRVAVVTGGGRGIGRAIALALAKHGADVMIADLDEETAGDVAGEVGDLGRESAAIVADVTDQASVDRMVLEAVDRFGRVDILVNNAGVVAAPGWEDRERSNEHDWDLIYAVNVKGVARVTDAVSPHMKERRYGKVVNLASVAGRRGDPTNPPYSASKAAVISLTQAAALELAPFDINVNAICPGVLWTAMWQRIAYRRSIASENVESRSPREMFDLAIEKRMPLGREQTPEDVGYLATFLASDAARNITGQAINVDSGSYMS